MEETLMQQYEFYLKYHRTPEALKTYLDIAEGAGADPIFLKIMRLSDLTDDEKGEFVTIYCDAGDIRNQKRAYQEQLESVNSKRTPPVTYVPYVDEHDPKYYEHPYGANGEKRPKSTIVVRDGGKSRRRSNRKSRRR